MLLGKVIWIIALILQIIIRYPYQKDVQQKPKERQEQLLLLLLTIGGLLIPLIYIATNWLAFANYKASMWMIGTGIIVMGAGLWLFWRSHADLGRNWSATLEIHDEHTLITQGVYQRVRHPMYAASWLMMIAQVLLFPNWIAGLSGIVVFGILYFLRVQKEEAMMLEQFGEPYQDYLAKTGRLIPKRLT